MTDNQEDTIFAKIIRREIPADIVYETDRVLAFNDISPQAPIHILIIPKKAMRDVSSVKDADAEIVGELFLAARDLVQKLGIKGGYRLVVNNGPQAGQAVFHLHMHLLAGRDFTWPPG